VNESEIHRIEKDRLLNKVAAMDELLKEYEQTAIDQSLRLERRNDELAVAKTRLQNILDMASDAIVSMDEDRKIILFNQQAQKVFGYTVDEIMGKPVSLLFPDRFRVGSIPPSEGSAEQDEIVRVMSQEPELFGLHKNGTEFPVELKLSKAALDGRFIWTAIIRDISEQEKLKRIVLQSEKMSAIGKLAGGIAHEINNPLGVILGYSQLLVRQLGADNPMKTELETIKREAVRCQKLVQELLIFSRAREVEKELVDIDMAIEGALSLIMAQSKVKNITVIKELTQVPKILGNMNQMQQVIVNLSNNAIDAMPEGGTLSIILKTMKTESGDGIEIQVKDTGVGIPKDIRSKIYEPFFSSKGVGQGTGLGLSIIYEIIQRYNGSISFDTQVGDGTTFRVLFPVAAAGAATAGDGPLRDTP